MVAGNWATADITDETQNSLLSQILSTIQSQEPVCPADKVQHWMSVRVDVNLDTTRIKHPTEPDVGEGIWINMPVVGSELLSDFTAAQKAADRLNDLGYFTDEIGVGERPVEQGDLFPFELVSIPYTTICAED